MGDAGIRTPRHIVRLRIIPQGQHPSAVIPHFLHADTLVGGGRVSVINPQKGTDLHLASGFRQRGYALGRDDHHLSRPQLPFLHVSEIQVGKALEGDAVTFLLLPHGHRGSPSPVPGRINPFFRKEHNGHGSLDYLLGIGDSLHQVILLVNDCGDHFGGIDIPAAHLQKMAVAGGKDVLGNFVHIVDLSHGHDRIGSMVGTHQKGLGLVVRDTADPHISLHLVHVLVEFRPKGRILNIVNRPVESPFFTVNSHSRTPRPQMGMIVRTEKQIKNAIIF